MLRQGGFRKEPELENSTPHSTKRCQSTPAPRIKRPIGPKLPSFQPRRPVRFPQGRRSATLLLAAVLVVACTRAETSGSVGAPASSSASTSDTSSGALTGLYLTASGETVSFRASFKPGSLVLTDFGQEILRRLDPEEDDTYVSVENPSAPDLVPTSAVFQRDAQGRVP